MMNIWGYGDSFVDSRHDNHSWMRYVESNILNWDTVHWDTESSRSLRTIIDRFLTDINKIEKDDLIFMIVPCARWSVPVIKHPHHGVSLPESKYNSISIHQFNPEYLKNRMEIDDDLYDFLKVNKNNNFWSETCNIFQYNLLVEESVGTKRNYISILKSLKKMFPKLILIGWTEYLEDDIILSKRVLESEIGVWDTMADAYKRGDGDEDWRENLHWSPLMEIKVGEYLVKYLDETYNDIEIRK